REGVGEAGGKRDLVGAGIDHGGSLAAAIAGLCGGLAIGADETIERIESEITDGPHLPLSQWAAAATALAHGSRSDQDQSRRLLAALGAAGAQRVDSYLSVFLTDKLKARDRLITRAIENCDPQLAGSLCAERTRVLPLAERRKALACRDRTAALITIAAAVLSRYQGAKDRRGLLDYDD